MHRRLPIAVFVSVSVALIAVLIIAAGVRAQTQAAPAFTLPRGLTAMPIATPADNPLTAEKIRLGEQLFFDKRLSRTKAMSCETCHVPEKGWTDGLALSPRFDGSMNTRHTPTLYGVAYYPDLYWDGRAKGLEAQILAAWRAQMGADPDAVAKDIEAVAGYAAPFKAAFGGPPNASRIVQALASFVRTIHAGDTPWDRHPQDEASLQKTAVGRGFKVFADVARCTLCHLPPLFSDTLFHNVGIGFDKPNPDPGRGKILSDTAQKAGQPAPPEAIVLVGAFKTPSLRGLAHTAPYFHDGRSRTWEEAVDLVLKGGIANEHLDEKLKSAQLTPTQRKELLAFIAALSSEMRPYRRPPLP